MNRSYQKQVLVLAVRAGELMMRAGAEVYRVEDTVSRICSACGIPYVEVFATPTGIFVSTDSGGEQGEVVTKIRRIKNSTVDLGKLSLLNTFSRMFTSTEYSPSKGMARLREIDAVRPYKLAVRLIFAGIIVAFFCLSILMTPAAGIYGFFVGGFCYGVSLFLNRYDINSFMSSLICCGIAAALALCASSFGITRGYDAIIIGAIMLFVPGNAITNGIRDFLSGDMLAGVARVTEACVIALCQAAGAGIVLKIWMLLGGQG